CAVRQDGAGDAGGAQGRYAGVARRGATVDGGDHWSSGGPADGVWDRSVVSAGKAGGGRYSSLHFFGGRHAAGDGGRGGGCATGGICRGEGRRAGAVGDEGVGCGDGGAEGWRCDYEGGESDGLVAAESDSGAAEVGQKRQFDGGSESQGNVVECEAVAE